MFIWSPGLFIVRSVCSLQPKGKHPFLVGEIGPANLKAVRSGHGLYGNEMISVVGQFCCSCDLWLNWAKEQVGNEMKDEVSPTEIKHATP